MIKRYLQIVGIVLAVAASFIVGWKLWHKEPVQETYAAEERQPDGSLVVERKPDPKAKPNQMVPKGAVVERIGHIKVETAPADLKPGEVNPCPPVDIDTTLVRLTDNTRRELLSSNGRIISATDTPVEAAAPYKELKWAAGISYNPFEKKWGGWVDRDFGPIRTGVEANQIRGGFDARFKAGLRF